MTYGQRSLNRASFRDSKLVMGSSVKKAHGCAAKREFSMLINEQEKMNEKERITRLDAILKTCHRPSEYRWDDPA